MKISKAICIVLLLIALGVSGYAANQPICTKDGVCFEIIVKNPIDPDADDDQWWGAASFTDRVLRNLKWNWLSKDEQKATRIYHIKRLLRGAKIRVNEKELKVMPEAIGMKERAFIHSVDDYYSCVIRVIFGNPERTFDLTIRGLNDM